MAPHHAGSSWLWARKCKSCRAMHITSSIRHAWPPGSRNTTPAQYVSFTPHVVSDVPPSILLWTIEPFIRRHISDALKMTCSAAQARV